MPENCNDIQLTEALEKLEIDLGKIHKWVNGTESETVNLGGVNTDTIRRLVSQLWKPATTEKLGMVKVGDGLAITADGLLSLALALGAGLTYDENGNLTIDPTEWSEDVANEVMRRIRVPFWLTGNTSWYVRADGSDTNDGSADTPDRAFRTIQAALNHVSENFNLGTWRATIHTGAGTFAGFTLPKYNASTGSITIAGAGAGQTVISGEDGEVVNSILSAGAFALQNMTIHAAKTANRSTGFYATAAKKGVTMTFTNTRFVFDEHERQTSGSMPIIATTGGTVTIGNGCSIQSNGLAGSGVAAMLVNTGNINLNSNLEINGVVASTCQCLTGGAWTRHATNLPVITGSVQGLRYYANLNSIISVRGAGADYFPGTTAGYTASGAQYT